MNDERRPAVGYLSARTYCPDIKTDSHATSRRDGRCCSCTGPTSSSMSSIPPTSPHLPHVLLRPVHHSSRLEIGLDRFVWSFGDHQE